MFKSIILLGGVAPDLHKLAHLVKAKKICADGGALKSMLAQSLCPDIVVGDSDSLDEADKGHPYQLVVDRDQNSTDFEKCISLAESQKLLPALVCGISGGEIDHQHNNISTFVKMAKISPMVFFDAQPDHETKLGFAVYSRLRARMKLGATVSLLPAPQARLSTTGLVWDLNEELLCMHGRSGARNRVALHDVEINISKGALIVIADAGSFDSIECDSLNETNVGKWFN